MCACTNLHKQTVGESEITPFCKHKKNGAKNLNLVRTWRLATGHWLNTDHPLFCPSESSPIPFAFTVQSFVLIFADIPQLISLGESESKLKSIPLKKQPVSKSRCLGKRISLAVLDYNYICQFGISAADEKPSRKRVPEP
jgi:hypothetical protein